MSTWHDFIQLKLIEIMASLDNFTNWRRSCSNVWRILWILWSHVNAMWLQLCLSEIVGGLGVMTRPEAWREMFGYVRSVWFSG